MECYQSVTNALAIVGKRTVVTLSMFSEQWPFNSLLSSAMKIDHLKLETIQGIY